LVLTGHPHTMEWQLRMHIAGRIRTKAFKDETEARSAFRRSLFSSALFGPDGSPMGQKSGFFDLHANGLMKVMQATDDASCKSSSSMSSTSSGNSNCGRGLLRWTLGTHISRFHVRWESFGTEAEAAKRYNCTWWSRVLFDPQGVPVRCSSAQLDPGGSGVAAVLQAHRTGGASPGRSPIAAIEAGEAPFVPRDHRGPIQRALLLCGLLSQGGTPCPGGQKLLAFVSLMRQRHLV